ncbi:MAG: phosphoglycerate mutase, partial [Firmicutes bacterium]|nr:phosphoglycerate mutase [Bacillota bacterium]
MKYILIIGDGMADNPLKALDGRTPLEAAHIPAIDRLASDGALGSVRTVPEGFPPGSDTALMSIFGSAPRLYYAGRAPLEAAAQGIELKTGDAAMRCNNVTLSEAGRFGDRRILSHSGGGIEGEAAQELIIRLFAHPDFRPLAEAARLELYPTKSYRHIAVLRQTDIRGLKLSAPHDHSGELVSENLPSGAPVAAALTALMERACALLENQTANGIWFWAQGTAARLQNFTGAYSKTGTVISAVPLCKGIAKLSGLDAAEVEGATGELNTNYEGKVAAAVGALETHDFVAVHLEGPDECSHAGDLRGKL